MVGLFFELENCLVFSTVTLLLPQLCDQAVVVRQDFFLLWLAHDKAKVFRFCWIHWFLWLRLLWLQVIVHFFLHIRCQLLISHFRTLTSLAGASLSSCVVGSSSALEVTVAGPNQIFSSSRGPEVEVAEAD